MSFFLDTPETRPPPPPPPRQTAFAQTLRIARNRPRRFAFGLGLWGIFYTLPLAAGLIQRRIFDGPDPASPENSGDPLKTIAILEPTALSFPSL